MPAVFKKLGATIINEGNYVTYQTKDFDFGPQGTKLKGMDRSGIKPPPLFPKNTQGQSLFPLKAGDRRTLPWVRLPLFPDQQTDKVHGDDGSFNFLRPREGCLLTSPSGSHESAPYSKT